jgi:hypothetical protein
VDATQQVLLAATARATALADADGARLTELLHEEFRWTSHLGETYGRAEYVRRNTEGHTVWVSQDLGDAVVVVDDDTAVLHAVATDVVVRDGDEVTFRMPVTQVWVRRDGGWQCLAGHAGPRLP